MGKTGKKLVEAKKKIDRTRRYELEEVFMNMSWLKPRRG